MSVSVVFVVANLDVGGAERHIVQIVPRLDRSLVQPSVFTIINKGALAGEIEAQGIPVLGPSKECHWHRLSKMRRILWLIGGALRLFVFLRRKRPDVIHFFLPMPYILGGVVSILAGSRTLVMSRRSLNHYQGRYPGAAMLERWLHKRMSWILGNSEAVLRDLRNEGVAEQQLGLIYNGVDIPAALDSNIRAVLRYQLGVSDTDLMVIIVANLIPYKGHDDLLRGLATVSEILPQNWKLVCVGHDSHGIMDELISTSEELGIREHVLFVGGRNDVPCLLQASDIAVLCSHEEGFSNAVLEAMAAGLPVVVTDVGGNAEAVRDGIDGLVVPPRAPEVLGQAIACLLNDLTLRQMMGSAARNRVVEQFSVKDCVNAYERGYMEITSGHCCSIKD